MKRLAYRLLNPIMLLGLLAVVLVFYGILNRQADDQSVQPRTDVLAGNVPSAVATSVWATAPPPIPSAFATLPTTPTSVNAPQTTTQVAINAQSQIVRERSFGAWSYIARRNGNGSLSAEVRFDSSTQQGIRSFAMANKALASQLTATSGQVDILCIFVTPMNVDAYRSWTKSIQISYFDSVYVKATDGPGKPPIQITIPSNSGDPLPTTPLNQAAASIRSQSAGLGTIVGVDAFRGMIDVKQLLVLLRDPQVLAVDVTANYVRSDLRSAGFTDAQLAQVYDPIPIFRVIDALNQSR